MYSSRVFLCTITALAIISGSISQDIKTTTSSSLRKLEGHDAGNSITITESSIDSFVDQMKDLLLQLVGMGEDATTEEMAAVEEAFEESLEVSLVEAPDESAFEDSLEVSLVEAPDESAFEDSLEVSLVEAPDEEVNPCEAKKPSSNEYFDNQACMIDSVIAVLEQAAANVTKGYQGNLDVDGREPITKSYSEAGLCPVNVHWHLGSEHYSAGQYDEYGSGPGGNSPSDEASSDDRRKLSDDVRAGFQCSYFDEADPKFTTEYEWEHCHDMHVGETYEVHWPHSAAGACGSKWQYQTPFYDGVFCTDGIVTLDPLNTYEMIGVQAQIYTIVNDENYYYDGMIDGMIVDDNFGADITAYTGSTTGSTRTNEICSKYTPITWQVDRNCHLISASSFDKMCLDMKMQAADMSDDLHAHGSRELVSDDLAANNQVESP